MFLEIHHSTMSLSLLNVHAFDSEIASSAGWLINEKLTQV